MTQDLRPHSASGNGGAGGMVMSPIQPLSSSGSDGSPGAAGVSADSVILGADGGAAQQRQVNDQGIVLHPEAGCVVAASPGGDLDTVLAAEPHAGDDMGRVAAACDGRRALVDHGV